MNSKFQVNFRQTASYHLGLVMICLAAFSPITTQAALSDDDVEIDEDDFVIISTEQKQVVAAVAEPDIEIEDTAPKSEQNSCPEAPKANSKRIEELKNLIDHFTKKDYDLGVMARAAIKERDDYIRDYLSTRDIFLADTNDRQAMKNFVDTYSSYLGYIGDGEIHRLVSTIKMYDYAINDNIVEIRPFRFYKIWCFNSTQAVFDALLIELKKGERPSVVKSIYMPASARLQQYEDWQKELEELRWIF